MKIALNATSLNDRPSGAKQRFVGIYGELVKRLPDVEFVIYEPTDCRVGSWFADASNISKPKPLSPEGFATGSKPKRSEASEKLKPLLPSCNPASNAPPLFA